MASSSDRPIKRADPRTIQDKFLVGYQGWFSCAGDGPVIDPGHHGWIHWIGEPLSSPRAHPNTDLWPDTSSYSPSELYPCPGLEMPDGSTAVLFSSRHPKTVQRHFRWMAEHGVDGAFFQRFIGECDIERGRHGIRRLRDEVGDRVREAAEKEGRVFAIQYDFSGVEGHRVSQVVQQDWIHVVREKGMLDSPSYLREKGRPVIALWGLGFEGRGYKADEIRNLARWFRANTPGGAYLIAGVPAGWRYCEGDADSDKEWVDVYLNEFDCITPWTVGRYDNEEANDRFAEGNIKGDLELVRKHNEEEEMKGRVRRVDYMPVVFPGFSGLNMTKGTWKFNMIKRNGGKFLWRQLWNVRQQGVRIIFGAMWDEYDEGTAMLPVVPNKRQLPKQDKWPFLSLDVDGYDLPADWYMRICGFAAEGLHGERFIHETFPIKELQDYWAHRPHYEDPAAAGSSSAAGPSASGAAQSFQSWEAAQGPCSEELPPPPYTLEADGSQSVTAAAATTAPPQPAMATRPVAPSVPSNRPEAQPASPPSAPLATRPVSPPPRQSSAAQPQSVSELATSFANASITPQPQRQPSMPPRPSAGPSFPPGPRASLSFPEPSHGPTSPSTDGAWSQAQWPPTEWNASSGHHPSSYLGMQAQGPQGLGPPPPRPPSHGSGASYGSGPLTSPGGHSSADPSWLNDGKPPSTSPNTQQHSNYFGGYPPQGQPYAGGPGSQPQSPYGAPSIAGGHGYPNFPTYGGGAPSPPPNTRPGSGQGYHQPAPPQGQQGGPVWPAGGPPPAVPPRPQGSLPPAAPPRPNNTRPAGPPYGPQQQPNVQGAAPGAPGAPGFPGTASHIMSSAPVNMALGAVERFSSTNTRRQVEKSVEGLAQSGSKFFARFNK